MISGVMFKPDEREIPDHAPNPISLTLVTRCSQSNLPKVNK